MTRLLRDASSTSSAAPQDERRFVILPETEKLWWQKGGGVLGLARLLPLSRHPGLACRCAGRGTGMALAVACAQKECPPQAPQAPSPTTPRTKPRRYPRARHLCGPSTSSGQASCENSCFMRRREDAKSAELVTQSTHLVIPAQAGIPLWAYLVLFPNIS